jgi:DNA-binding transcriptional ArsR family regulator
MIAEVLALLPPEAGTGRGARPVEQAPARRIRRPAERLERLAGEVLGVLARRSGLAVSEIAHSIGATPREITRPITWLLGRGAITKTGERRGTRYYLARRAPAARTPAATRPSAPSRKKPRRRRG